MSTAQETRTVRPRDTDLSTAGTLRAVLSLLLVGTTACAVVRPVDDVIAGGAGADVAESEPASGDAPDPLAAPATLPDREALRGYAEEELEAFDERCRELLNRARAEDAGYEALMEASRALVFNADMRIQADVCFRFDPSDLPGPQALIEAEDDVTSELKAQVRSLAISSRDLADRALLLREEDAAARLFSTLGSGLFLWTLGPLQALANGAATTLPLRIGSLAEDHPGFEGASPLRLKGRFQSRAPWPYKDKPGGVETLSRAVEFAPIPLNLLFLGDAHWIAGDPAAAVDSWERATRARADAETRISAPLIREIARVRLVAAAATSR